MKEIDIKNAKLLCNDKNLAGIIHTLAYEIWQECYKGILSDGQIKYMLENFYSIDALEKLLESKNRTTAVINYSNQNIGFLSYYFEDLESIDSKDGSFIKGGLMLDKLYILKDYRKLSLASSSIEYLKKLDCKYIWLVVNIHNAGAIAFYKKSGFKVFGTRKKDIGGGFFMDDYIMKLDF